MEIKFKEKQSKKTRFEKYGSGFKVDKRDSEELAKGKTVFEERFIKTVKYNSIHYENLEKLNKDFEIPAKNELKKIRVQRAYNAYTFILAIIQKHKQIDDLVILTFNINEKTLLSIFNFIDEGIIKKFTLCVSESVKSRMPKRAELIKELHKKYKNTIDLDIAFTWNHCKIALIEAENNYYVIEGSGNYSDNEEVEQYIFENNKESYNFDKTILVPYMFNKAVEQKRSKRGEILK